MCSWLNRWRYAFILWTDRVLTRWEYAIDKDKVYRAMLDGGDGYAFARMAFWRRWEA